VLTALHRPRKAGEILDAAFQLYRRLFVPVALATGVFMLPALLLDLVVAVEDLPYVELLVNFSRVLGTAAVVRLGSDGYLGRPADGMAAVRHALSRFFSVLGASIVQGLMIIIGLLMFVVPGVIFAAWTFAMTPAVMLEGRPVGEAFTRSRELARDHLGHIIATGVIVLILGILVQQMLVSVIDDTLHLPFRAGFLIAHLMNVVINPFPALVTTVLYYDLRIRKEAFDVQLMAESLDDESAQA